MLTSGAEYVRDIARRNPDMAEPVEVMAEAALELCSGRHVGCVTYSRRFLHSLGLSVKSLDGQRCSVMRFCRLILRALRDVAGGWITWHVAPADGTGGDLLVQKEGHSPQATPRTIDLHHATSITRD